MCEFVAMNLRMIKFLNRKDPDLKNDDLVFGNLSVWKRCVCGLKEETSVREIKNIYIYIYIYI